MKVRKKHLAEKYKKQNVRDNSGSYQSFQKEPAFTQFEVFKMKCQGQRSGKAKLSILGYLVNLLNVSGLTEESYYMTPIFTNTNISVNTMGYKSQCYVVASSYECFQPNCQNKH